MPMAAETRRERERDLRGAGKRGAGGGPWVERSDNIPVVRCTVGDDGRQIHVDLPEGADVDSLVEWVSGDMLDARLIVLDPRAALETYAGAEPCADVEAGCDAMFARMPQLVRVLRDEKAIPKAVRRRVRVKDFVPAWESVSFMLLDLLENGEPSGLALERRLPVRGLPRFPASLAPCDAAGGPAGTLQPPHVDAPLAPDLPHVLLRDARGAPFAGPLPASVRVDVRYDGLEVPLPLEAVPGAPGVFRPATEGREGQTGVLLARQQCSRLEMALVRLDRHEAALAGGAAADGLWEPGRYGLLPDAGPPHPNPARVQVRVRQTGLASEADLELVPGEDLEADELVVGEAFRVSPRGRPARPPPRPPPPPPRAPAAPARRAPPPPPPRLPPRR